jgi:8-oxo-dGTP pyrophosphatase MutT (NUDIX family)
MTKSPASPPNKRKTYFKLIPAVYLILVRGDKILMLRRFNTGYEDGNYSLVAGHVEENEPSIDALRREALEEAGIIIKPRDIKFVHLMHRKSDNLRVDLFFEVSKWQGEVTNKEPNKCDDLSWFSINDLPINTIPYVRQVIDVYTRGIYYSEYGW